MRLVAYPLARLGRVAVVSRAAYQTTGSVELSVVAGVCTDITSIAVESRPFFATWAQLWIACIFLPWFFESYWDLFVDRNRRKWYGLEVTLLTGAFFMLGDPGFLSR